MEFINGPRYGSHLAGSQNRLCSTMHYFPMNKWNLASAASEVSTVSAAQLHL